jgi:glycerol-3-phosphate dehydrogenase subunit B
VAVVAKGAGSTRLAPGTVDVLGYAPDRVDRPAEAVAGLIAARPDHPYARVGVERLGQAVDWLRAHVDLYRLVGGLDDNWLLPTAVGAAKPSAVVPETMVAGDLRNGGRFLLCGLRAYKDFYAAYAADNLELVSKAEVRAAELQPPTAGEADMGALRLARLFEDDGFRRSVVREVLTVVEGDEAVGFPAVLGLHDAQRVWSAIQDELGRPVFEIPTPPPSVPGIRLLTAVEEVVRRAGGRVVVGSEVIGSRSSGSRLDAVIARTSGRDAVYPASWFVLASGGLVADGIVMGSDRSVREAVFDLPVRGVPGDGEPFFRPEYFAEHPLSSAGVMTDAELRPVDGDGGVVYENLFAAGAVLGGAVPWKEKSGEGIALGTGFAAAGEILERVVG